MPGRSRLAVVLVLTLLIGLVGLSIYAVLSVAQAPSKSHGAKPIDRLPNSNNGLTATQALADAKPLITSGQWPQAISLLEKAAEFYPQDQEIHLHLARCYSSTKDYAKCYQAFSAALAIGPDSALLHAEAATNANAAGLFPQAIEHYTKAQSLAPNDHNHPLYLGMMQIKAGQDKAAMVSLLRATVIKPDLAIAWGTMGELELRNNNTAMAIQHLEKARAIDAESYKWRLSLAKAYARNAEPQKAVDLLINLTPEQKYSDETLRVLSQCFGLLRKPADAAAVYEAAAKLRPLDAARLNEEAENWRKRIAP